VSTGQGTLSRAPRPSSLADVLDLILDKGLVIDAYVRVSVVGIEILTIDARIVIASVDTYLHFAEAVNRLDLPATKTQGLPELFGGGSSENGSNGHGGAQDEDEDEEEDDDSEDEGGDGHSLEEQSDEGDDGQRRRPAALVRRLADRGKWEDA
jgi:hypothetical protein